VFGSDDWEVGNPKSYRETEHRFLAKVKKPIDLQPNPPDSVKPSGHLSEPKRGRTLDEQVSWREYRDKVRGIGSQALNSYVVSLHSKPPVGILIAQNDEYKTLSVNINL
jgi:hypothetical protein